MNSGMKCGGINRNMKNKRILLEDIPGSGKSTAGANLRNFLKNMDIPSRFWHEGAE